MRADLFLRELYDRAVAAVSADTVHAGAQPPEPRGRTVVVGCGKAAAAMAVAVERRWPADRPLGGIVVTRHGHMRERPRRVRLIEAGHPVPDQAAHDAGAALLDAVVGLGADDLVLALISGGGSALAVAPAEGLGLADKQAVTRALLRSGAAIGEINTVRKQLSRLKGGRLALAARPAPVVSLIVSDVPGDDPTIVACGPTVADPSTPADARVVLARYGIAPPDAVARHLGRDLAPPAASSLAHARWRIVATADTALDAAAEAARTAGVTPIVLGGAIEGEARAVAEAHAARALEIAGHGRPTPLPAVLLSGGETSVTVTGDGRGGRNAEFLLALGLALGSAPGISALACDTDGIDGTEDNAGALWRPDSLVRAHALGLDPAAYLARNDAYGFFAALGDLIVTGPSLTNVNDFRAILVERAAG